MITFIGVDPSSNFIGVAIMKLEIDETSMLNIISIETLCIDLSDVSVSYDTKLPKLVYKMGHLYKIITGIYRDENPMVMGSESAFLDRRKPSAFAPLQSSIMTMQHSFINLYPNRRVITFTPPQVKNGLGAPGNANKEAVYETVIKDDFLKRFINMGAISEHEIDAIGVVMCIYKKFKNQPQFL